MGASQAHEFAALVGEGLPLEAALDYHLTSNHFPPVPREMIPVAKSAIDYANEGVWDVDVDLPEGVEFRGQPVASIYDIIEAFHLDPFIDYEEEL